jgi:hypothetical protein
MGLFAALLDGLARNPVVSEPSACAIWCAAPEDIIPFYYDINVWLPKSGGCPTFRPNPILSRFWAWFYANNSGNAIIAQKQYESSLQGKIYELRTDLRNIRLNQTWTNGNIPPKTVSALVSPAELVRLGPKCDSGIAGQIFKLTMGALTTVIPFALPVFAVQAIQSIKDFTNAMEQAKRQIDLVNNTTLAVSSIASNRFLVHPYDAVKDLPVSDNLRRRFAFYGFPHPFMCITRLDVNREQQAEMRLKWLAEIYPYYQQAALETAVITEGLAWENGPDWSGQTPGTSDFYTDPILWQTSPKNRPRGRPSIVPKVPFEPFKYVPAPKIVSRPGGGSSAPLPPQQN